MLVFECLPLNWEMFYKLKKPIFLSQKKQQLFAPESQLLEAFNCC